MGGSRSRNDFQEFLEEMKNRGFGWLIPEGVERELKKRAAQRRSLPDIVQAQPPSLSGISGFFTRKIDELRKNITDG